MYDVMLKFSSDLWPYINREDARLQGFESSDWRREDGDPVHGTGRYGGQPRREDDVQADEQGRGAKIRSGHGWTQGVSQ